MLTEYDNLTKQDLAQIWVNGKTVDWMKVQKSAKRKISIPTLPFIEGRFWPTNEQITFSSEKCSKVQETSEKIQKRAFPGEMILLNAEGNLYTKPCCYP